MRRCSSALAARSASTGMSARARAISAVGAATVFTSWVACIVMRSSFPSRLIRLQHPRAPVPHIARSKQLEIFLLLPFADLRMVARQLSLLDREVIIDELLAEAVGKAAVIAQRRKCLLERLWQQGRLGLVGCVSRGSGIELACDAIATGDDLRGHIEIRIGGGLARAVLEPGRR